MSKSTLWTSGQSAGSSTTALLLASRTFFVCNQLTALWSIQNDIHETMTIMKHGM